MHGTLQLLYLTCNDNNNTKAIDLCCFYLLNNKQIKLYKHFYIVKEYKSLKTVVF